MEKSTHYSHGLIISWHAAICSRQQWSGDCSAHSARGSWLVIKIFQLNHSGIPGSSQLSVQWSGAANNRKLWRRNIKKQNKCAGWDINFLQCTYRRQAIKYLYIRYFTVGQRSWMIVTLLLQGNQAHLFYSVEYLIIATKIGSKFHDFYMLQM